MKGTATAIVSNTPHTALTALMEEIYPVRISFDFGLNTVDVLDIVTSALLAGTGVTVTVLLSDNDLAETSTTNTYMVPSDSELLDILSRLVVTPLDPMMPQSPAKLTSDPMVQDHCIPG